MAYINWFRQRSSWRIRYSITLGRTKKERSRYRKSKNAANALLNRVQHLEQATRDGRAEDKEILQWIEEDLIESYEAAVAFRAWAETDARSPKLQPTDYDTLLQMYEAHALRVSKAGDPHRKTHNDTMSLARRIVDWLQGNFPYLPDLADQDCRLYQDHLVKSLKPSTVSHYITTLRVLLDCAIETQMASENPARNIKIRQPKTDTVRRVLKPEEARRLLEASTERQNWIERGIPTVVRLGLYAGLRDEEMCWARKDWLRGRILAVQRVEVGGRICWTPKDHEARRLDVKQALADYLTSLQHDGQFFLRGALARSAHCVRINIEGLSAVYKRCRHGS